MEEVVSPENYGKALKAVIRNEGAPGIDGMTTEELERTPSEALAEDQSQTDGGNLHAEPCEAERDTEAERGNAEC